MIGNWYKVKSGAYGGFVKSFVAQLVIGIHWFTHGIRVFESGVHYLGWNMTI